MQTLNKYFHLPTAKLQELYDLHSEIILERLAYYKPSKTVLDKILAPLLEMNDELILRTHY